MLREFRVLLIQKNAHRKDVLVALMNSGLPDGVDITVEHVESIYEGIRYFATCGTRCFPHFVLTHHDDDEIIPPCERAHCAEQIISVIAHMSPSTGIGIFTTREISRFPSGDYPLVLLPEGSDDILPQILLYQIADAIPGSARSIICA
jgi:hypothetical protein